MDFHCSIGKEPPTIRHQQTAALSADARKARIYYRDGRTEHYNDQKLAFAVWLALPKGVRAAFRGANDNRPVYPWSYVDV
jgi:hypothetical protein